MPPSWRGERARHRRYNNFSFPHEPRQAGRNIPTVSCPKTPSAHTPLAETYCPTLVLKTRAMFRSETIRSNFYQWGKGMVLPALTQAKEMSSTPIYYLLQVLCLRETLEYPVNIPWLVTWHTEPAWGSVRHMGSGHSTRLHGKTLALGCIMLRGKQLNITAKPAIGVKDKKAINSGVLLQY